MKTAQGLLLALNEHLEFTAATEPHSVGRLHVDSAVRYLLGIPRTLPDEDPIDARSADLREGAAPILPGIRLEGRDGRWIEFIRRTPGRNFSLSMMEGEQDQTIDEMQAVSRLRLFIEHWGEETQLTSEIRLSPEQRRKIADLERTRDTARRERRADGDLSVIFRKRVYILLGVLFVVAVCSLAAPLNFLIGPGGVAGAAAAAMVALGALGGLWLLFKTYRVEVDRRAGFLRVIAIDGAAPVGELDELKHADVTELPKKRSRHSVFVMTHRGEKFTVGSRAWTAGDAEELANAVNDALDLPEADRKFLAYRRNKWRDRA